MHTFQFNFLSAPIITEGMVCLTVMAPPHRLEGLNLAINIP